MILSIASMLALSVFFPSSPTPYTPISLQDSESTLVGVNLNIAEFSLNNGYDSLIVSTIDSNNIKTDLMSISFNYDDNEYSCSITTSQSINYLGVFTFYDWDTDSYLPTMDFNLYEVDTYPYVIDSQYGNHELDLYFSLVALSQNEYDSLLGATTSPESYTSGYNTGYDTGYEIGKEEGIQEGATSSYTEGYNHGYASGKIDGVNSGDAYNTGYRDGYDAGLSYSNRDFGFINLFTGIADTPIMMMRSLFGFEIFGTTLLSVVLALFTGLVVIHLLKKLIK